MYVDMYRDKKYKSQGFQYVLIHGPKLQSRQPIDVQFFTFIIIISSHVEEIYVEKVCLDGHSCMLTGLIKTFVED